MSLHKLVTQLDQYPEHSNSGRRQRMDTRMIGTPPLSSKSLIGAVVKNLEGKELGRIEELLVEPEDGFVFNLIMSTRGHLGSKKPVAIPWHMLSIDENGALRLDMDKEFLKGVPAYRG